MNTLSTQRDMPTLGGPTRESFKSLIRRGIDLRRLYVCAANASEPGLRLVLTDNVRTLDLIIGDLQAQLRSIGCKSAVHGSVRASAHRHVAGWMLHALPQGGWGWIRLLGHHESAFLHAFEQVLAEASSDFALTMRRQLPRLHGIHLDMDNLAGTTR